MGKKINQFIFWAPRTLAILFILFLSLFSLDIFDGNYGFWETILGLFMHNIPSMVLLIILIISWKYELVGGIIFNLVGLFYGILFFKEMNSFQWDMVLGMLTIAGPAFLVGFLFLIGWKQKKIK